MFKGDGKTRYRLSNFSTKSATEVRLTNDERRQLLTIFSFKKQVQAGIMLLTAAFFTLIMGITFCAVAQVIESVLGTIICLLPSIILFIAGIYMISTAPKIEKSIIKAYEFTVTDIMHKYVLYRSRHSGAHYATEKLTVITPKDAVKYSSFRAPDIKPHFLFLQLDGNWVEVNNIEGFAPIRFGIKIGDKVRCAILEYGKYCYISLY